MEQVTSTFLRLFSIVASTFSGLLTYTYSCQLILYGFSLRMQFLRNLILTKLLTGARRCAWMILRSLCMSQMLGSLETTGRQILVSGLAHSGHLLVFFVSRGRAWGYLLSVPRKSSGSSSSEVCLIRLSIPSLIFFNCCLSLRLDSSMLDRIEGRLLWVYLKDWFSISTEMLVSLKKVRAVLQMRFSPSRRLTNLNRLSCRISGRYSFMLIYFVFQQQNWQQQMQSLVLGSRDSVRTFWQYGQAKQKLHRLFFNVDSYNRLQALHCCEENSGTVQQWQQQVEQLMQVQIYSCRMRRLHLHSIFTWGQDCSGGWRKWMPVSVREYIFIIQFRWAWGAYCQRKIWVLGGKQTHEVFLAWQIHGGWTDLNLGYVSGFEMWQIDSECMGNSK